ncbi:class I SAM-dependent methyltransferase [Candidatus Woesearchaeota archaeon]|nr:MAG: class I SAM-dependent methyltransferase [Candidatus Woesearchaeota archaeon]
MKMSLAEKRFVNSRIWSLWRKATMRGILARVLPTKGTVIEIGCGIGITTEQIAKTIPFAKIEASDFDPAQVRIAQKRLGKKARIRKADAAALPYTDAFADAFFAFLTFHHIGKWKQALKEAARVLKPGGNLYVEDLELRPFPKLQHFFLPTDGIFSRKEFVRELEKNGFRVNWLSGRYRFKVIAQKAYK